MEYEDSMIVAMLYQGCVLRNKGMLLMVSTQPDPPAQRSSIERQLGHVYNAYKVRNTDSTFLATIEIRRDIAHTSCIVYFAQSTDAAGKRAQ